MRPLTRKMLVLTAALAAPAGLLMASIPASSAATGAHAAKASGFMVAPYVDMTNNQEGMLDKAAKAGLKAFTAAFVIGSGCTPIWGDTLPVTNDPTVTGDIKRAESEGATPIVSFGGAAGVDLAQSCTNVSQLAQAYKLVVDTLHVNHIDFDVEGAAIADRASIDRRFQAIAMLERMVSGLVVSVTIPTFPNGPDFNGKAFLMRATPDGAHINVVNVMAMDYYGTWDNHPTMGAYAKQAAKADLTFLKKVFPGAGPSMVGVTPMIGQNDDSAEKFTEANAQALVSYAKSAGIGRLAFWSVDRDQPCSGSAQGLSQCTEISQQPLAFTKIFDQF